MPIVNNTAFRPRSYVKLPATETEQSSSADTSQPGSTTRPGSGLAPSSLSFSSSSPPSTTASSVHSAMVAIAPNGNKLHSPERHSLSSFRCPSATGKKTPLAGTVFSRWHRNLSRIVQSKPQSRGSRLWTLLVFGVANHVVNDYCLECSVLSANFQN